jgi:DNA-binding CsgD family transcriptional regulator
MITLKFPWYASDHTLTGILGISIKTNDENSITIGDSINKVIKLGLLNRAPIKNPVLPRLIHHFANGNEINLTKKEKECASLLLTGKTSNEIAKNLFISPRTVEKHIDSLRNKTQCRRKAELIQFLYETRIHL